MFKNIFGMISRYFGKKNYPEIRKCVAELKCNDSERIVVINMVQVDGTEEAGGMVLDFEIKNETETDYQKMSPGEQLQWEFVNMLLDGLKYKKHK